MSPTQNQMTTTGARVPHPRLPRRSASRQLAERIHAPRVSPTECAVIRRVGRGLVPQITDEILRQIAAYSRHPTQRRRDLITKAVASAVELYADVVEKIPSDPETVSAMYFGMGRGEALAERSLDGFRAAVDLATHRAAEAIRHEAEGLVPDDVRGTLCGSLLAYMGILLDDVARGYAAGVRDREADPCWIRRRLVRGLAGSADPAVIGGLAARVGWQLPAAVVVCSVDTITPLDSVGLPQTCVWDTAGRRALVITDPVEVDAVSAVMRGWPRTGPVFVTVPVPLADVPAAIRWTERARDLVESGVIPADPVVRCADHHVALLLNADPTLSRWEASEALAPLEAFKDEHRRAMVRTLRLWLLTGANAPALAAELGIHEHTVRNHKLRLRAAFGSRLQDPEFVTLLLFALGAGESPALDWVELERCG
ncbi:helix-turn-helix domain-containing protein [Nocardioides sp. YR527]|uniref:helix-turn-helix domain-containing protein n=1 Tax=Nocardioides sp. YR527 TaxID=1881028 RepID=UPI000B865476|nr:helix-turn-helix domain-containing protein [Nocardioides sp. YR527]